ncbi:ribonuclease HI family protein [candidate division KSB1 bacterium]
MIKPYSEQDIIKKIYRYIDFKKLSENENINKDDVDRLFNKIYGFLKTNSTVKAEKKEMQKGKLEAYIDGSSLNNPGDAGLGFVIKSENGDIIEEYYRYIGIRTNNEAEYEALIALLNYIIDNDMNIAMIYSDSALMVNQIGGKFKVKSEKIKPLFLKAHGLLKKVKNVKIEYIERKYNLADKPAKKASELKISK